MKDSTPEEIGIVVGMAPDVNCSTPSSAQDQVNIFNLPLKEPVSVDCYAFEFDLSVVLYQVDIAYAPFIERFELAFGGIRNFDIKVRRPKLAKWIEVPYTHYGQEREVNL